MLFVLLIKAFVFSAVLPDVFPVPVHHPFRELAVKAPSVGPLKHARAAHLVELPLAFIARSVGPKIDPPAFLYAVFEVAVVVAAIAPDFDPVAALLVQRAVSGTLASRVSQLLCAIDLALSEEA